MKKVISIALVAILALSVFAMVGCGKEKTPDAPATTLKFGMGVVSSYGKTTDADGETNGASEFNTTAVAVLLDADSKIVAIDLDTAQFKPAWTSEGKIIATEDFRTKYEKGADYGMAAYGQKHDGSEGAPAEWDAQADAFMTTAVGKTLDEVKAMMGEDAYAIGDLAVAGCTMNVADFVVALEKAIANAAESKATADNKLNLAIVSSNSYSNKDASEESEGLDQIDSTVVAAVVDADGKVVVSKTDCVQLAVKFDAKGVVTSDVKAEIKTKLELGYDYNMKAFGKKHDGSEGQPAEWFEQAAAFDAALVGKTASDFAAFAGADTYAVGDLAAAGCTMAIGDMIAAAEKAAK